MDRSKLTRDGCSGAIFDRYGVRALIIPGSLGMVTSLMCLSVSTGDCDDIIVQDLLLTRDRVLSIRLIVRRLRRFVSLLSLHAQHFNHWPLILQASGPHHRDCLYCGRHRWRRVLIHDAVLDTSHRIRLDDARNRFSLHGPLRHCLCHASDT
jgi:hypothetical protein